MLSAITQPSMSNNNDKTTRSRPQSPTRKIPSSGIKIEPRHESFHSSSVTPKEQSNDDAQQRSAAASSSPHILKGNGLESDLEGDRMEYTDEAPLHPLAPARPLVQQQQPSYAISTQAQRINNY
ncbi:hypothetical protein BCR41DRAFT_397813 [Lobosporangium transversale]|uniref:Uncharacterized protein n=1 Tax=Lobosporangium transversale TaxID=64571 RepID=A0A1Y2GI78_9FUNG|nr:hypothetical protein BCR41DRAFT_397813 [Lobosporangium transversale]ORZ11660.1 hypothetical protein BCR41DRAFT_397813 [Lobosporangium transversale]|eukprot:XP_021879757.1 hypothetical protein BCR41DRAFT_397813 [Lobosporangium transversale]